MDSAEDLAVPVLRGTVEVLHGWPVGDRWAAMAAWRQEPVGAVLVGRRRKGGEVAFDIVACRRDGDEWYVLGSGGSTVEPAYIPHRETEKVCWFYSQQVVFEQENGEDAYVSTFVGVAAPGVGRLMFRFSDGSRAEMNVTSGDRLVFVGAIQQADDEMAIQVN
jgi:hypothetical protein